MDNALYDYSPIVSRPTLVWPKGARIAFYVGLNIEHFVINQPFRHKYLEKALEYIAGHEGVWLTTSDDIAAHYANTTPMSKVKS